MISEIEEMKKEYVEEYGEIPRFIIVDEETISNCTLECKDYNIKAYQSGGDKTLKICGLTVCVAKTSYTVFEVR